jgi:hypothetical protein
MTLKELALRAIEHQGGGPRPHGSEEEWDEISKYTDKQILIEIFQKLNDKEMDIDEKIGTITLGSGSGYAGFCVVFSFDREDNLMKHGCWE